MALLWIFCGIVSAKVFVTQTGDIFDKFGGEIETGTEWIAIYPKKGTTDLKKVKISVSPEKRFENTPFWQVSTPEHGGLFMIKGVSLKSKSIPSAPEYGPEGPRIFKNYEPKEIKFANFHVRYYATFGVSKSEYEKNPGFARHENYRPILEMGKHKLELKISQVNAFPYQIVWMGDINWDGMPDVLVRPHEIGKMTPSTFFISEKKKNGYQMVEVGTIGEEAVP